MKLCLIQSIAPSSRASLRSDVSPPDCPGSELAPQRSVGGLGDIEPIARIRPPPEDGSDSRASNACLSFVDSGNQAFGPKLRQVVWLLAEEFSDSSTLLRGVHDAKIDKERINALAIEAMMQRRKSPASASGVI